MEHKTCGACDEGMPWFQQPCPHCHCEPCETFRAGDQTREDALIWFNAVGIPIEEAVFSDMVCFREITREEVIAWVEAQKAGIT